MFADEHRLPSEIKIIDFGLATKYLSAEYKNMTEKVGTIYTIAPQVLQVRTMCSIYSYICLCEWMIRNAHLFLFSLDPVYVQGVYTSKCDLVRTMQYLSIHLSL
jgi:serine/threonine protein kinase